jgi:hypothetical protein
MLDARAKDAYRRRLAEIDDDIEQARAIGDAERAAQADTERDFLVGELSRAVGLGGRDRRAASASERARAGVTRAVRQAIARIGEHLPQLGEHLNRTIRTGTYCAYLPDPRAPAAWEFWRAGPRRDCRHERFLRRRLGGNMNQHKANTKPATTAIMTVQAVA